MFEHGFPKHWSTLKKFVWLIGSGIIGGASAIWKTVTGTLIHITDALASPVKELSVEINSATGLAECGINCAGANLYDHTYEKTGYLQVDGGRKTSSSWAITYYIEVSTGNYVAKGLSVSGSGTYICIYDSAQTFIRSVEITANEPVYFSIANGEKYIRMSVRTGSSEYETAQLLKYDIHTISWQTEAGSITSGTLTVAGDGGVTLTSGGNTYQLASITPISTLSGENNIWTDVNGEITLEYLAQG